MGAMVKNEYGKSDVFHEAELPFPKFGWGRSRFPVKVYENFS